MENKVVPMQKNDYHKEATKKGLASIEMMKNLPHSLEEMKAQTERMKAERNKNQN